MTAAAFFILKLNARRGMSHQAEKNMPPRKANRVPDPGPARTPRKKRPPKEPSALSTRLHKWRWAVIVALFFSISVVVVFAWWVSLFNAGLHVDDALRNLLVFHVGTTVENRFDPLLEVVMVSQEPPTKDASANTAPTDGSAPSAFPDVPSGSIKPAHRRYFAGLLKTLADVTPKDGRI